MKNKVYSLYSECFPNHKIKFELFIQKLDFDKSEKLFIEDNNILKAFCIFKNNSILLLCVDKAFRMQGYGTKLLKLAEEKIKEKGYNKIILGNGEYYLFQGVPKINGADKFFIKNEYAATWESIDMTMNIGDFKIENSGFNKPENVIYRYAALSDKDEVYSAVNAVQPSWLPYFKYPELKIYVAEYMGKIVGFELLTVGMNSFSENLDDIVGEIGCVGVLPEARKKGIGLYLVGKGTEELKKSGCNVGYIGYTYLESWYSKLGYKTYLRFWMGEKNLLKI